MDRTDKFRSIDGPVFLTLYKPYRGIDASTVAKILNDAIVLAGLSKDQFSAKSFRPTGATRAVEQNFDRDLVMQTGRWKTGSVFFEHYVHAKPPTSYTDCIIDLIRLYNIIYNKMYINIIVVIIFPMTIVFARIYIHKIVVFYTTLQGLPYVRPFRNNVVFLSGFFSFCFLRVTQNSL